MLASNKTLHGRRLMARHPKKGIEAALKYARSKGWSVQGFTIKRHKLTLILSGVWEMTPDLADALYEATGGDIEFSMRDGQAFLEFDRASAKLQEAIRSAIEQVHSAGVGAQVTRVESSTESGH